MLFSFRPAVRDEEGSRRRRSAATAKLRQAACPRFGGYRTQLSSFRGTGRRVGNGLVEAPRRTQLFLLCSLICSEEKIKWESVFKEACGPGRPNTKRTFIGAL